MKPTKEEKKANAIAERLVNVLSEMELFLHDPDMIFTAASFITTKKTDLLSPGQLKAVRATVEYLQGEWDDEDQQLLDEATFDGMADPAL